MIQLRMTQQKDTLLHPSGNSAQSLSRVQLFVTPRPAARQAPLSMGLSQASILEWVAVSFSTGTSEVPQKH